MNRYMSTSIKAILLSSALLIPPGISSSAEDHSAGYDADREITKRLDEMETIVQPGNMNLVRWKISSYLDRDPKTTEKMLGRMVQYFPLIEHKLKAAGLPEDLKFLPIIESSLNPNAVSHMGAVGIWQFMYYTGRENGLRINGVVDERRDPVAATDAAVEYLSTLYERFDDWALAIAAYNSGPGRVERAIRYSNSRNFWELMRFLPRETRNYIPKYLAAAYLCKHYSIHGLEPQWPDLDVQLTDELTVHQTLSLYKVSEWTELPYGLIRELNPGFRKGYIPASSSGYRLILPQRVIPLVEAKLNDVESWKGNSSSYIEAVYQVRPGESLEQIARIFEINPSHLKYWNKLDDQEPLCAGQELKMFLVRTKHNEWLVADRFSITVEPLKSKPVEWIHRDPVPSRERGTFLSSVETEGIVTRRSAIIRRGQSLRDVAMEVGLPTDEQWSTLIRHYQSNGPPGTAIPIRNDEQNE